MSMSRLQSIIAELQGEQGQLQEELAKVDAEHKRISGEIKQIQQALSALGVKAAKATRRSGKAAPTRDDVTAAVAAVLGAKGVCHKEVLQEAVEAHLTEQGKSRVGFKLRFDEALQDQQFAGGDDGYQLTKPKPVKVG